MHFKNPVFDDVVIFDDQVLTVDSAPERYLTLEKKVLVFDSLTKFRVQNAAKYYRVTSGIQRRALELFKQRVNSEGCCLKWLVRDVKKMASPLLASNMIF
ncbi:MAG: hypothetical protein HN432_15370 [Gammaproteobacteria bacterium]|nr:hypothetical protein [Gammaproteobacteria bacterium]